MCVPLRAYAIRDGEDEPAWWITFNCRLFTRATGLRESVLITELTWVADGYADVSLYPYFEKKFLYCANPKKY
jgi:hypothetical protein